MRRAGARRPSCDRPLATGCLQRNGELRGRKPADRPTGSRPSFLLLFGDSSVGKTRLLYETAREVLGDFDVLAPDRDDGDLVNKIAAATFPLPPLIVWLDELQRFLDGPYLITGSTPITAATVRRLLDAHTPVIIVGTMLRQCAIGLGLDRTDGLAQRYSNAADVLDKRRLRLVFLQSFSDYEREDAVRLASQDPRLAEACKDHHYNVTEVLVGAPNLVYRYENATQEQQAILHAAIDAIRLGIRAPLTEKLLAAAARGYLTTLHPDDTWFLPALSELTADDRPGDHATAPLICELNPDRSEVLGYTVALYLLQHLTPKRRNAHLSAVTWQALIDHTDNHEDLFRLAESTDHDHRSLYRFAELLYGRLSDTGNRDAADQLVRLLHSQGRIKEAIELLQTRADAGDGHAFYGLVELLKEKGHIKEAIQLLRTHADAGDGYAAYELVELLAEQGHTDELWAEVYAGTPGAAERLTNLLAKAGDTGLADRIRQFGLNPDGSIANRDPGNHRP